MLSHAIQKVNKNVSKKSKHPRFLSARPVRGPPRSEGCLVNELYEIVSLPMTSARHQQLEKQQNQVDELGGKLLMLTVAKTKQRSRARETTNTKSTNAVACSCC